MIDEILLAAERSQFDVRTVDHDTDAAAPLTADAVDHYRMQWAIASVLAPDSILQLTAQDVWAERVLRSARPLAHFVAVDLPGALPGTTWDLIHVDGRQDPDQVFHDLELAVHHGEYVLVDHHLLDRRTFLAVSEFLHRYRTELECHWTIAGLSGHILVKPLANLWRAHGGDGDSASIRDRYDRGYYLQDCGGHAEFRATRGRRLDDRLVAIAGLTELNWPLRILDLGCGRGELAAHFARRGAEVTAVDYSPAAIALANECLQESPECASRVELVCGDVAALAPSDVYDAVVAADLVEHLGPAELDATCAHVAEHLTPMGWFVLHSYPNRWFYEREYPRRRAYATQLGSYLPLEPRTRYEQLMHINEHSLPELHETLAKHFEHVVVWAGDFRDMRGTLEPGHDDLVDAAPDLFAVASHRPIDRDALRDAVAMDPLGPDLDRHLELSVITPPSPCRVDDRFEVTVRLDLGVRTVFNSNEPAPVHLSYHWLDDAGDTVVFDGERTRLSPWLSGPGAEAYTISGTTPSRAGTHVLRLTLVQEGHRWFDADGIAADVVIEVAET